MKLKLMCQCERMFGVRRASIAKDIVSRILLHPKLFISTEKCYKFFVMTDDYETLDVMDINEYLSYVMCKQPHSQALTFDQLTLELIQKGAQIHLFQHDSIKCKCLQCNGK